MVSGNGCGVRWSVCAALLAFCCLPLPALSAGESWGRDWARSRARRAGTSPRLFQLGPRTFLACMLLNDDDVPGDGGDDGRETSRLADRIANRRTTTRRPGSSMNNPSDDAYCPNGVTYFDGCNSCSCGTDQLCTLKACNADTMVHIFDPCSRVSCGYHQRCQAICVGQVCQLKPLCVSDDSPDCHNCPWLCVDERLNCSDNFGSRSCKPTLACYKPNM